MTKLNNFFFGTERIHIQDALWFYGLPTLWIIVAIVVKLNVSI